MESSLQNRSHKQNVDDRGCATQAHAPEREHSEYQAAMSNQNINHHITIYNLSVANHMFYGNFHKVCIVYIK